MQQPLGPPPPPAVPSQYGTTPATPGSFDRDVFLLRQKHLSIEEKYFVLDTGEKR